MLDNLIIDKLINVIPQINDWLVRYGFNNLRLFAPLNADGISEETLHFIVDVSRDDLSLFDKAYLKNKLSQLLEMNSENIILITGGAFDPDTRSRIVGDEIEIFLNNAANIREFFLEHTINFSRCRLR